MMDAENMRRWSMPWESKSDRNTVTWHQTRVISRMAMPPNTGHAIYSKAGSDRSQTTTPGNCVKQFGCQWSECSFLIAHVVL